MRLKVKAEVFLMQKWEVIELTLPGRVPLESKYNIPADPIGLVTTATCPAWMGKVPGGGKDVSADGR